MNWDRLSLVTAPATTPVTLADAKAHLRVDDTDSDTLIDAYIQRAVACIDGPFGIGVCMVTQTWMLSLDEFPECISIPIGPVASITSIQYQDQNGAVQTLAGSNYYPALKRSPAEIYPAYGLSWPTYRSMPGSVQITFVAGVADTVVPADLKAAVLLLVGHFYANREAVNAGSPTELPLGVEAILSRYRVGTLS